MLLTSKGLNKKYNVVQEQLADLTKRVEQLERQQVEPKKPTNEKSPTDASNDPFGLEKL